MSQVDAIKTFGGGNRTSQLHAQSSQLNRFGAASVSGAPAVSFGRNSDHFSGGAPSQSGFLGDIFKSIGSWIIWPWNWFGGGSNSTDQSAHDTSYHAPPVQEAPKPQPVHTSHPAPVREDVETEEKPAQRTPAPVEPDPVEPPAPAETTKPVQPAAKETRADNGDRHLEMLDVVNRVRALDNKTLTSIIFNGNSQIAAASPSAVTAEQKAAVAKALNISEAEAMPVIMMVRSLMAIATAPIEAKGGAHQNSVSVDPVATNPAAAKAAIKSRLDTLFTPSGKQSLSQRIDDTKLTAMANACVARATNRDYAITGDNQVPFAKLVHQVTDILADHAGQKDDGKIGKDTLQRRQDAISFGEDTPLSVLYKFSASSAPYTTGSAGGIATTVPGVTQADTSIVSRLYANRSQDSQEVLISDNRPEYGAEHAKKAYEFRFYEAYFRDAQPAGQKTPDSKKLKALKVQMARHVLGNIIRDSKGDTTTTSDTIIGDDYKLTRGTNSRKYQAAAQRAQEIVEQAITRFQEVGRGKTAAEFEPFSKRIDSVRNDYAQALKVFDDTTIAPGDAMKTHKQKQNATRAFLIAMLTNTAPEGVPGVKA
ncbi:MAG: hypothetical protein KC474_11835, partial [Cyanobacteria bacterium HKST-UBA04]|nr:hypothetical protein [Cyanobacteria bacterium HKST-UBA04]